MQEETHLFIWGRRQKGIIIKRKPKQKNEIFKNKICKTLAFLKEMRYDYARRKIKLA